MQALMKPTGVYSYNESSGDNEVMRALKSSNKIDRVLHILTIIICVPEKASIIFVYR